MSGVSGTQPKSAPADVTKAVSFHECGRGEHLFQVRPGVPMSDALGGVSSMLDDALELLNDTLQGVDGRDAVNVSQSIRLVEMASAIVQSIEIADKSVPAAGASAHATGTAS